MFKGKKTHAMYCEEVEAKHGGTIIPLGTYTTNAVKIEHRCTVCDNVWLVRPNSISMGLGCPRRHNRSTTHSLLRNERCREDYPSKVAEVHGTRLVPVEDYVTSAQPIKHRCENGSIWVARPNHVLKGQSCTCLKCSHNGVSKMSLLWLAEEAKRRRIIIQHAGNKGEFRIPGTKYKVDGYNARKRLVFEFHGDRFHGNPDLFPPHSRPHPWKKQYTAAQLYSKTVTREREIEALGYTVISMWESEFQARHGL